jgi:hypothetical protein
MLTQVVLIVFAMFGVLALVIDIGYARVTRAQMQQAADVAALEGLRNRDVGVINPATGVGAANAFASDCLRRIAAHRAVHWVFDDNFDPTDGDPYQFGAGPRVELSEGVTNLHALQTMSVPDVPVYKPDLQLNQLNDVHGDMVSGRFCYTVEPGTLEGADYAETLVCEEPQRGSGAYSRVDFNPSPTTPIATAAAECPLPDEELPTTWPASTASLATVNDSAFLVRLRRSNELRDFADQVESGVASSGPALPLLFGKGTTIHGDDPGSDYSIRRDGLTVRATAIADIRPALHVGLPQTNPARLGVTPYVVADSFVPTVPAAGVQVTINPAAGLVCRGLTCTAATPPAMVVGRFVDNLVNPARAGSLAVSTVGRTLPAPVPIACTILTPAVRVGYGPVYSLMASGATRIIGFTRISLNADPARPANPCAAVVQRASFVAPTNATAVLANGLPLATTAQPAEVRELLTKNLRRSGAIDYSPVLAPVLVR